MTNHKNKHYQGNLGILVVVALLGIGFLITVFLHGTDITLFHPKGLIAIEQHRLMFLTVAIMLVIAVPTLGLLYFFAWKYRESNDRATYDSRTIGGKSFVFSIWAIPLVFFFVLASIMWSSTHKLAPQKTIASQTEPLTIQVVALRWKWLFIYPEQNIATVNFAEVPVDTPIQFELTADEAPMNSFWIPHLGGMLYAMTGHDNRLNLMADTAGDYQGSAAEISGAGFAGMKFTTRAGSQQDFDQWVQTVKQSSSTLDDGEYQNLLTPSENNPARFYATAEPELFSTVLAKYAGSHHHVGLE
ncbi:MAG TPA: COX aromatic rich motif-containing protein [Patescibacteria group bacterium]|nr:COX aromatic rich motif-containing protein [Patescibacteria group bacterium]